MNYEDKYKEFWEGTPHIKNRVGYRTGEKALIELREIREEGEVYKLIAYFEGCHNLENEDRTREINISYKCTAGVNIFEYNTIDDLLNIAERDNFTEIQHIDIVLYENNLTS